MRNVLRYNSNSEKVFGFAHDRLQPREHLKNKKKIISKMIQIVLIAIVCFTASIQANELQSVKKKFEKKKKF